MAESGRKRIPDLCSREVEGTTTMLFSLYHSITDLTIIIYLYIYTIRIKATAAASYVIDKKTFFWACATGFLICGLRELLYLMRCGCRCLHTPSTLSHTWFYSGFHYTAHSVYFDAKQHVR